MTTQAIDPRERVYLQVAYAEKDEAKRLGAHWDPARTSWYVLATNALAMTRWPISETVHPASDSGPSNLQDALPDEDRTFGGSSLFVDLIPKTCWFTNVRSAVIPSDWDRLRHRIYARAGQLCEVCGAHGRLEAHERWHYDPATYIQTLRRLIALCADCHTATHFGLAQIRGLEEDALAHLQGVNQWTAHQTQAHVQQSFATWEERNRFTWTLELSMITRAGFSLKIPGAAQRAAIAQEVLDAHD